MPPAWIIFFLFGQEVTCFVTTTSGIRKLHFARTTMTPWSREVKTVTGNNNEAYLA
jgi:hypothetical protein